MKNALIAALQRNPTYTTNDAGKRKKFRVRWGTLLRDEAKLYVATVTDEEHREVIKRLQSHLKTDFGDILIGGHPRYGTLRKAFDLYLKFLWRLGKAVAPPHCPIDRNVLDAAGINASWTECDDDKRYSEWDAAIDSVARPRSSAEWEYDLSLKFLQPSKARTRCQKP